MDVIDQTLADINGWIQQQLANVSEWFLQQLQGTIDYAFGIIDDLSNAITNVFNNVTTFIGDLFNDIANRISSLVSDALDFLSSVYDRVAASITDLFDSVTTYISDTFTAVYEEMLSIADTVKSQVTQMYDEVVNAIKSIVQDITTWLGTLLEDVKLAISSLIDRAVSVVNALATGIQDFISSVIDVVGASLRELLDAASKIPAALSEMGEGFMTAIEEFIGQPLDKLPAGIWTSLNDVWGKMHGEEQERVIEALGTSYLSDHSPPKNNEELRSVFNALVPESGIMRGFFLTLFGVLSALLSIASITSANAQVMLQEYAITSPYALLEVGDAIRANHFGLVGDSDTKMTLRRHGHSIEDANHLLEIGHLTPPEGEALSWFLRGIYSEAELDKSLDKSGWNDRDKIALKEAAKLIPPVQDLITMAVREVFTPEIAERFGQFDEFPEAFKEWGAKVGLSEEWSKNYWASHWALPSPQMGFEMLHRRVISGEDLDMLLKSADVMPFWRQKIVDISYANYTRVDIRRMHKMEVLSEEEVYSAYQDIGYNADKARRLTDFTLELNRDTASDDDVGLLELTRSNILGFYEDGLLDRPEAMDLLTGVGLSVEAASLYLMSIDMSEERGERKAETSLILDQAKAGLITFEQGQDKLAALNLESRELSKALTKLIRDKTQRTKLPTKADLEKMLTAEIITAEEYKATLQLLGYSEVWVERLYKLLTGV